MGAKYTPAHAGTRGIFIAALFLAIALICGATEAGTILIDDFTQPTSFVSLDSPWPGGTNVTQPFDQNNVNVIGGRREATFVAFGTDPGGSSLTGSIGMVGLANKFQVGSVGNTIAPIATLFYRGGGDLNANLIDGTNDRIEIQFYTSDAEPIALGLDVKIEILSPGGASKTLSVNAPNSQLAFTINFPFASFTGSGNLADVESIRVTFNDGRRTPNVDFEVRSMSQSPSPPDC